MKRSAIAALVAVIATVACQEIATSPGDPDFSVRGRLSNPPPPPIDTGASVSFGGIQQTSLVQSRSSDLSLPSKFMLATAGCENRTVQAIVIPVRYLYNTVGNSGWLHVESSEADSLTASSNGMVRMRTDENGVQDFEGKGTVSMIIDGCPLVINLASIIDEQSSMADCSVAPDLSAAAAPEREQGTCFFLSFSEATLDGQDIGGAQMTTSPECEDLGGDLFGCDPNTVPDSPFVIGSSPADQTRRDLAMLGLDKNDPAAAGALAELNARRLAELGLTRA